PPHCLSFPTRRSSDLYFASAYLRRLAFAPALAESLREEIAGADAIHLHSVFLWPTWAAARLAREADVPYVVSPRGMLVRQLIAQRNRLLKSAWIALIEKRNLTDAAAVHATSSVEAAELKTFDWPLRRVAVIPNGSEPSDDTVAGAASDDIKVLAQDQPLLLFFGRLAWVKG